MPVLKQNEVFAGRYVLLQIIGEGGFSEVWKARDQMADDAVVAIKIYAPNKGLDDYGLRQFRNEFSLTHNLSHPHLLKVYHFDICDGSPYLIMPYCPFGSLMTMLGQQGPLSERQAAQVMDQIGSALADVHGQDPAIIHQDIKPDNILLLHPEYYMLADFGISSRIRHTLRKATAALNSQTLTVAYAPPERFDRNPTADPSSDIFSLGVTLYEMCTNSIPWDGAGGQCLLKGASVPALPKGYSPEFNAILEACMSVDRSQRPTAAEIHQKGKYFLETGQWQMSVAKKKGSSSKKAFVPYLIAAALALLVLAGFWYYDKPEENAGQENAQALKRGNTVNPVAENSDSSQLENKLKTVEAQLVKANQQLVLQDSLNELKEQNRARQLVKDQEETAKNNAPTAQQADKQQAQLNAREGSSASKSLDLQKYLNQISDPKHSREARSGWKQEALGQFANGSVRVVDESEGAVTEYRAGIFLTMLLTSPHQVVVREIKRDGNNKITELRVSKQAFNASM